MLSIIIMVKRDTSRNIAGKIERKWEKERERKLNEDEDGKDGNDRVVTSIPTNCLIIYENEMIHFASHETSWMMDSGFSIHTASWKDLFTSYRSSDFGIAKMGNGGLVKVINIGDMHLKMVRGWFLKM